MSHSSARQVSQAAARRDIGMARMTAVTVSVGIAAAVGSTGLAMALGTAGNASSTATASTAVRDSDSDSSDSFDSSRSSRAVQVPRATTRAPQATTGGS